MSHIFEGIKSLFYPKRCIFCRELIEDTGDLLCCPKCEKDLLNIKVVTGKHNMRYISAAVYANNVRKAIHRFKFRGRTQYAPTLAYFLHRAVSDEPDFDLITWAPTSALRKFSRGYDQSELLARQLGKRMGIDVKRGLKKFKHTKRQSALSAEKRCENVRGKYRAYENIVNNKRILIVDDVRTTGATMNECVDTLLRGGARDCVAVTVARTEKNQYVRV